MADTFTDSLSAYLDGELDGRRRRRMEAHLARCAECSAALAELRAIVTAAPQYQGQAPARDLWPHVEAGLDEAEVIDLPSAEPRAIQPSSRRAIQPSSRRAVRFSWPQLLAASILMAALGGGAVWIALRSSSSDVSVPAMVARPAPDSAAPKTVAYAEARYEAAVDDLTRVLEEGRGRLDTATVRVIEESLRKIDAAIAEARVALQRDPASGYLNQQIAAHLRRKLALLRLAADAIART
ncbi:MAG: anti-sigma factor family protein [Gemmatimonadales bacterium]